MSISISDPLNWFNIKNIEEFDTKIYPLLEDAARAIGMKRGKKKGLASMRKIGSKSIYYFFFILENWIISASDNEYETYSENIYNVLKELASETPEEYVIEIKKLIDGSLLGNKYSFRTDEPQYILIKLLGDIGNLNDIEYLEHLRSKLQDDFFIKTITEAINSIKERGGKVKKIKSKIKRFSKKDFLKSLSEAPEAYIEFLSRLGLDKELVEPYIDTIAYVFTNALYKDLCKIYSDSKARMVLEEHAILDGILNYFEDVLSEFDHFYDLVCKEIIKSKLPDNVKKKLCTALRKIAPL